MTMRETADEGGLDALFAEARAGEARPPAALFARVMADAEAARPGRRREAFGAALLRAIGGWPSAAGLAAVSAAGLLIGFAAPEAVPFLGTAPGETAAETAFDLIDLAPGYGVMAAYEG
jgi:hypothetical protein